MKKLKLNISSNVGDVLTSEELKHVLGGETNGSGSGSGGTSSGSPKIDACKGKKQKDPCEFIGRHGYRNYGCCQYNSLALTVTLYCSDLNYKPFTKCADA